MMEKAMLLLKDDDEARRIHESIGSNTGILVSKISVSSQVQKDLAEEEEIVWGTFLEFQC